MTIRKTYTQNDRPTLTITWYDGDDALIDLSSASTPTFHMDQGNGTTVKVDTSATIVGDGTGGQTQYTFAAGDLDTVAANYEAEFQVLIGGKAATYPSSEKIEIIVIREIS